MTSPTGVLLVNLGTPSAPDVRSVRRFLREFLSDPFVVQIPTPLRWLLLNTVILPFRPYKTAQAYRAIWQTNALNRIEGSPLWQKSQALTRALRQTLGDDHIVTLGMRYNTPSLSQAIDTLLDKGCQVIKVIPLFPQYAMATTGSIKQAVDTHLQQRFKKAASRPTLHFLTDFYNQPAYIEALAISIRPTLEQFAPDIVLMSYHGLPVKQLSQHCRENSPFPCASTHTPCSVDANTALNATNRYCYRAQCYSTSAKLAQALTLDNNQYRVAFQSRLGRTPWIGPYTDSILEQLVKRGIQRIAVVCPSFVTDCLETLEEIGIRANEQWKQLGGQALYCIPCLNDHPAWISALKKFIQ